MYYDFESIVILYKDRNYSLTTNGKMVISCCVRGCKSRGSGTMDMKIKYFRFPKDAVRRQLWVKAISREDFVPTNHRVCNAHFTNDDYQETINLRKLTKKAIPSVFNNCSVNMKKVCLASALKPSIPPPVKNRNDSWDHTYVQTLHEASTYIDEMCSDDISIDPSSYMIQTLSVDENLDNEPNLSKSNEIELSLTECIKTLGRPPFQDTQKDWKQISLAQSYTIKKLRKKVKILQQKVRRYATKIKTLKVGDSSSSEA